MFDPFQKELPIYTFTNRCKELPELELGDETGMGYSENGISCLFWSAWSWPNKIVVIPLCNAVLGSGILCQQQKCIQYTVCVTSLITM